MYKEIVEVLKLIKSESFEDYLLIRNLSVVEFVGILNCFGRRK